MRKFPIVLDKIKVKYDILKNFNMRLKKFSTDYFNELFEGNKNYAQVFRKYYDVYLNISILLNIISVLYLFLYAFCFTKAVDKISLWFNHLKGQDIILIIVVALSAIRLPLDFYRSLKYKIKTNKHTIIFSILEYFVLAYFLSTYLIIDVIVIYNEKPTSNDLIQEFVKILVILIILLGIINITIRFLNIGDYVQKQLLSIESIMSNAYILNQVNLMLVLSITLLSAKKYIYSSLDKCTIPLLFFIISTFMFIILVCICFQTRQYYVKNTLFNNNLLGLSVVKILTTVFFVIVCFHILRIDSVSLVKNLL